MVTHGKKASLNDVKALVESKGGVLLSDVYLNALKPIFVRCGKGHEWQTTFNHLRNRNQWCKLCHFKFVKDNPPKMSEEAKSKISNGHWIRNGKLSKEERKAKRNTGKKNRFLFRLKTEVQERLKHNIRTRTGMAINGIKNSSVSSSLGCSWAELRVHLECKFQPGMTWDNYGYRGWHVDHIIPLALFNLQDPEEFKKACHYSNLQPLWAKDNLSKGDKIIEERKHE